MGAGLQFSAGHWGERKRDRNWQTFLPSELKVIYRFASDVQGFLASHFFLSSITHLTYAASGSSLESGIGTVSAAGLGSSTTAWPSLRVSATWYWTRVRPSWCYSALVS